MGSILVVDDDTSVRTFLRSLLEVEGYEVRTAQDGTEALRSLREGGIDLVLLDLIMPDMEGLETLMILKREQPEIKVIAISGGCKMTTMDFLPTAIKMGANEAFKKPFNNSELLQAVSSLINH